MDRLVIQPQPSVMPASQHFAQVPKAEIERSTFDRSHGWKGTFDSGLLIPVLADEMLPGDTFNCRMQAFARLATPKRPFMDNLFLDSFFFFVPNRLVWEHWKEMNGEQKNPTDSTVFTVPVIDATTPFGFASGSLGDYFGLPITSTVVPAPITVSTPISSLPFRAYNLIWNQWFRDENLQASLTVDQGDGPDNLSNYTLMRRGKRKDYFTGALPWPQKGLPVLLPLGVSAPVMFPTGLGLIGSSGVTTAFGTSIVQASGTLDPTGATGNIGGQALIGDPINATPTPATITSSGGGPIDAYADLGSATSATINAIRTAFQIQRLLERDARGGTRYTETIRAHFGVVSPDARLQRPELLGTGSTPIIINPVAQTSQPATGAALGQLAAFGTVTMSGGHGFTYSATEHGFVIGLVSVRADLTYQYGINRMWSRQTRYDHYWPALSHLGEQQIANRELFPVGDPTDANCWGYQERYAEYRYKPSVITGQFRSNFATPLDSWHLALDHVALPVLGGPYIEENPPVDRVIVDVDDPQFLMDAYFNYRCARPMPVYSVPGLVDHL